MNLTVLSKYCNTSLIHTTYSSILKCEVAEGNTVCKLLGFTNISNTIRNYVNLENRIKIKPYPTSKHVKWYIDNEGINALIVKAITDNKRLCFLADRKDFLAGIRMLSKAS